LLSGSPIAGVIFSLAFVLTVAFVMIRFNTEIFFIPRRTYLRTSLHPPLCAFPRIDGA
jgi:hypothetical protein